MRRTTRFSLAFSAASVAAAFAVGWLLSSDASPFDEYFLHNVYLPNVWRALNVMPFILGMLAGGNLHATNTTGVVVMAAAFVLQWAAVGFALSKLFLNLGRTLR